MEVSLSVWLSIDLCMCERPGKESPENSAMLRAHIRLECINMSGSLIRVIRRISS